MQKLVPPLATRWAVALFLCLVPYTTHADSLDECERVPSIAGGQGYGECLATCYAQHCGVAELRCPTVELQRLFKLRCTGKCREMMRQKQDLKRLITFCRGLRLERERASRFRNELILKHNMWMAKRNLVHQLRMQWEQAKARRQAAAAHAYYQRMQLAHNQQMEFMREKLQMKEKFFMARAEIRHKQRMELITQLGTLKKDLMAAQSKGEVARLEAIRKNILAKREKVYVAEKKEKKLKVDYHQARVERSQHEIKQVEVKKDQIKEAKSEAEKQKDQKRLEDLAKQLGELAGKQAALTRKAEVERQKLQQAQVAYASVTKQPI